MNAFPDLRERLAVYYVADPEQTERDFLALVAAALSGGATSLQLRAKHMSGREMYDLALRLRDRCAAAGALFFVNDRVDVAIASSADGVHVGVHDLPLLATRRLIGPDMTLGYSPLNMDDAIAAKSGGADYVGLGPVFGTVSKSDAQPKLGLSALAEQIQAAGLPSVGIGGIDIDNAASVIRAGADGIAVISAIQHADHPQQATESLLLAVQRAKADRASQGQ
ncbi:MAG: thiamine phosphate synthase [Chloroflexota bacterium]|nr:thiamine phosphate synthase [Chloroflexota bacterium]